MNFETFMLEESLTAWEGFKSRLITKTCKISDFLVMIPDLTPKVSGRLLRHHRGSHTAAENCIRSCSDQVLISCLLCKIYC